MPWDKIDPAPYKAVKNNFEGPVANSKKRMAVNEQFKLMDQNAKWVFEKKDDNTYSLNIDKFKAKVAESEAVAKKFKALNDYKNGLVFEALPYEKAIFAKDPALAEKKERWYESLSKDIYVEEAINVLGDMQTKTAKTNAVAVKKDKSVKTR
jgi:carboxyl-terminal processing protease